MKYGTQRAGMGGSDIYKIIQLIKKTVHDWPELSRPFCMLENHDCNAIEIMKIELVQHHVS